MSDPVIGDIKDTTGFFVDDTLDTEGEGAYSLELNAGTTPNKRALRVDDDKLETVDLTDPSGLSDGVQIKVSANGTEISKTEFDNRRVASLIRVTREYNTPDAELNNGRIDGVVYEPGLFQELSIEDIIIDLIAQTIDPSGEVPGETLLAYGGGAPDDFAGEVVFRNTAVPQAISQVLAKQDNSLWWVTPTDNKTVIVVERVPGGPAKGIIGVNVTEQSITGADVTTDRPAIVTDKAGTGLKTQHGGPAYVGVDTPSDATFGAPAPLTMKLDLTGLKAAAVKAGKTSIDAVYGYKSPNAGGVTGWQVPRDATGKVIAAEARLVQVGVISDDLQTRTGAIGKAFQSDLLTHPNLKLAFEAKITGAPAFYLYGVYSAFEAAFQRIEYDRLITAAAGRVTKDIGGTGANSQRPASLFRFEASFTRDGESMVAMAIFALFKPEWRFVDGFVDVETGELVIDAGDTPHFSNFVSTGEGASIGAGLSMGFTEDPTLHPKANSENPMPFIRVDFLEAAKAAEFRAHVVTVEPLGPFVSPLAEPGPYGAAESTDGQKHNVIFNAAEVEGHFEPRDAPRDDSANMQLRADNLAKSLLLPSMAKGNIKIFPGDSSLTIGMPANGGVIVKVKHQYVPFFTTTFWLEGSPDIDNPEQAHFRKKIGEHEGLTQTNSASIVATDRRTDAAGRVRGASKTPPHNHADDESGGSVFGDVSMSGVEIVGTLPDGSPNFKATRGGLTGVVDLKWISGISRLVSGDLMLHVTATLGTLVDGVIFDLPITESPVVTGVTVLVNGVESDAATVAKFVTVGGKYPLVFIEKPGNDPPKAAIVVYATDFVVDHGEDDGGGGNTSTPVLGIEKPGESAAGDTDDLTLVAKRRVDEGGGSISLLEPRWMLYMAEREFEDDVRRCLVQGPHEKSADRFARKQGQLADVMRYSRTEKPHVVGRLVQRADANIAATRPRDLRKDDEGPLDYENLHPAFDAALDRPTEGIRGCAVMFDALDWSRADAGDAETTPAEKKSGLRYKVLPIIDHRTRNSGSVPTGGDEVNESTQVLGYDSKSDGVSLADLDDILKVENASLSLYMESHHKEIASADPHSVQGEFEVVSGKAQRFGYITDGSVRAFLSDIFDYNDHSLDESQLAVLLSKGLFKHTTPGGAATETGPMDVLGLASKTPTFIGADRLFGKFALDITRKPIPGAEGTWVIEIPFNLCALPSATAALGLLKSNDDKLKTALTALPGKINTGFTTLAETNDAGIYSNVLFLFEKLFEIGSELYDNDADLGAFIEFQDKALIEEIKALATCVTAGFAALASTISTCSSCHAAAPICPAPSFVPTEPAGLNEFEPFPTDPELTLVTPEVDDITVELSTPCA